MATDPAVGRRDVLLGPVAGDQHLLAAIFPVPTRRRDQDRNRHARTACLRPATSIMIASMGSILRIVLASLALLPLTGCAALFAPDPVAVAIDSRPQGAIISYQGHDIGRTPATVALRAETSTVTLRLDGHHPREVDVGTIGNGNYVLGGFLLWGPIELLIDAIANAWKRIDGAPLLVELAPEDTTSLPVWTRPVFGLPPIDEPSSFRRVRR